ncbi:hypothetical protein [Synechococcus sp. PCC 7336]|uniref:hypothetical protein n=1 Tax=Synechococcus sp. PCC 7336 TaxID=195250 RepID=UPI000348BE88|nr:hypothetical protein [Synechococcus sp. PCC 7336]
MFSTLSYERYTVQVPPESIQEVAGVLQDMGVSIRHRSDGSLTALIRYGLKGALDRIAIVHVEMRFSHNRQEREQWLEMCWQLPFDPNPQTQP